MEIWQRNCIFRGEGIELVESTSYTPLWVTIVGYITTVVPCIVSIILEILNRKKQKTFEESLKQIKKAQVHAIDKHE